MGRNRHYSLETQLALLVLLCARPPLETGAPRSHDGAHEIASAKRLSAAIAVPATAPAVRAVRAPPPFPARVLLWLAATPVLVAAFGARRHRRDPLHGGAREEAARAAG